MRQTSLEQARDAARHTDQQMQALREQHEQQERTAVEQKEELVQAQKQLQDNLETVQKQVTFLSFAIACLDHQFFSVG